MAETTRELDLRWDTIPDIEAKKAILKMRREIATEELREKFKAGDKLRACQARCNAREANFVFSHWDGPAIISKGGAVISPGSVYSVNGQVKRY